MNLHFAWKLGLKIWKTNVGVQKMDDSTLEIFGMVIIDFQIEDKIDRPRFFQEIYLRDNIKFEVISEMLFLKLSNVDISFDKKTLM